MLNIEFIMTQLCNFLLSIENVFPILHSCSKVDVSHPEIDSFFRRHLLSLTTMNEMRTLTLDSVEFLLSDPRLEYWPVQDRFQLIQQWCKARVDRASLFSELVGRIDFKGIDPISIPQKRLFGVDFRKAIFRPNIVHEQYILFSGTKMADKRSTSLLGIKLSDMTFCSLPFQSDLQGTLRSIYALHDNRLLLVTSEKYIDPYWAVVNRTTSHVYVHDVITQESSEIQIHADNLKNPNISHGLVFNGKFIFVVQMFEGLERIGETMVSRLYRSNDTSLKVKLQYLIEIPCLVTTCIAYKEILLLSSSNEKFRRTIFCYNPTKHNLQTIDTAMDVVAMALRLDFLMCFGKNKICVYDVSSGTPSVSYSTDCSLTSEIHVRFNFSNMKLFKLTPFRATVFDVVNQRTYSVPLPTVNTSQTCDAPLLRYLIDVHTPVHLSVRAPRCHIQCPHCGNEDVRVADKPDEAIIPLFMKEISV
ncbi:uncharacterized protein LOC128218790 isoform X2 [Mya arenaria]|nr:uncharacterized protein LOC128218790 isoform X2 [Mya arenaria]